jgi:hypothetical protein
MAEMVGLSRTEHRRTGSVFGLIRAFWQSRSTANHRVRTEEWSDYMLRDVGLERDHADQPSLLDWPIR